MEPVSKDERRSGTNGRLRVVPGGYESDDSGIWEKVALALIFMVGVGVGVASYWLHLEWIIMHTPIRKGM